MIKKLIDMITLYKEFLDKLNEGYRTNTHQTHFEDLIFMGRDAVDELNNKIEGMLSTLEGDNPGFNYTTKIDGCLAPQTIVKTTIGDIPISQIINDFPVKKYIVYGKTNDGDGNVKEVEAKFPRVNSGEKEWVTLEFENNSTVTCTYDHQFKLKNGGFIKACDLKESDDIEEL